MCRVYVDLPFCFGIFPAAKYLTAGKDNQVRALFVDDGELQFAMERCRGYGLPHKPFMAPGAASDLINIKGMSEKVKKQRPKEGLIGRRLGLVGYC